jgi:hypothetical protein
MEEPEGNSDSVLYSKQKNQNRNTRAIFGKIKAVPFRSSQSRVGQTESKSFTRSNSSNTGGHVHLAIGWTRPFFAFD